MHTPKLSLFVVALWAACAAPNAPRTHMEPAVVVLRPAPAFASSASQTPEAQASDAGAEEDMDAIAESSVER